MLPRKKVTIQFNLVILLCALFFVSYSTLSIVRHLNFQSYGYDLGINDQTVWFYSQLSLPFTTIDPLPHLPKLAQHVEIVYALIAPFYWVWSSPIMLILISNFVLCSGGIAVYLMARRRLKNEWISWALTFSYLMFYGVQFAAWFDVHSTNFVAPILMWYLYFLDRKNTKLTLLFFFLAITAKENIALYTFIISLLYMIRRRNWLIYFMTFFSVGYLLFIFYIFFPYVMQIPYQYQNEGGIFSTVNPLYLINTKEKLITMFYSYATFGFLPLLNPLTLPLIFAHFTTFFVLASDLPGAQGLFGHYRVTLAPLFIWSTIVTIGTFRKLNSKWVALYIVVWVLVVQYVLHLPLSYLTKEWFWTKPVAVNDISSLIKIIPTDSKVVSQNNITPHLSQRRNIYTLYPIKKDFTALSVCGAKTCNWFTWHPGPSYLVVDSSETWDARHFLANRTDFVDGIKNLESNGIISLYKKQGNARIYKVLKNP